MSTGISFAPHPPAVIFAKETRQLGLAQDHAAGESWSWDPHLGLCPKPQQRWTVTGPHNNILDIPEAQTTAKNMRLWESKPQ